MIKKYCIKFLNEDEFCIEIESQFSSAELMNQAEADAPADLTIHADEVLRALLIERLRSVGHPIFSGARMAERIARDESEPA